MFSVLGLLFLLQHLAIELVSQKIDRGIQVFVLCLGVDFRAGSMDGRFGFLALFFNARMTLMLVILSKCRSSVRAWLKRSFGAVGDFDVMSTNVKLH